MIKKIAWDAFKNTGNINAFLEFKQIEMLENQINNQIPNIGMQQTTQLTQQKQEQIKGE